MSFYQPLVIHKSAWDRLKRQTSPQEAPVKHNDEYIKGLIEKSQVWIKTWPDSVEGHIKILKEQKKKQREKDLSLLKENAKNKIKTYKSDAVKKAKQLIFEDSCYGKKLISALIESKTLEERNIQIEFQKKKNQEKLEQEKSKFKPSLYCSFNLDENHEKIKERNKLRALECVNENKCMQLKKELITERNIKNLYNPQDTIMLNQLIRKEIELENEAKKAHQKSVEEFEIIQQKIREDRKKREELDEELIQTHQKEQEKLKCRIQKVLYKIHNDEQDTALHKHVYKIIEDNLAVHNGRYKFIDDRIKSFEQEELKKGKEDEEKSKRNRKKLQEISEYNKNVQKKEKHKSLCENKCVCDKQCLIGAPCKDEKRAKTVSQANRVKDDNTKDNFLKPQNKLVDGLRIREKQPSGWSGAQAAHEQFAKAADEILQECKNKHAARKVVDEYRKLHDLDSTSLPVPNY